MNRPAKLSLAHLPTPIERLHSLSKELQKQIYIKRDDLTGVLVTGNKIRKLEYVLRDARDKGADTVVTCGGLQSNHVRATVVAARQLGLQAVAVLRGQKPEYFDGNTLFVALLGAQIQYVTDEEYDRIDEVYDALGRKLRLQGLNPYFIPEGASNALGVWGYIEMMEELAAQQREMELRFDSIFVALGSGGTQSGLILGKYLTKSPAKIIGINVYKSTRDFQTFIESLCSEAIKEYQLPVKLNVPDIIYYNNYIGIGYAQSTDEELASYIKRAQEDGIILDPVYTGKAMRGMMDLLLTYPERFGDTILFMHTGGLFGLLPERERLSPLLSKG
jgi:D-cysteine desulfhydrase